MPSAPSSSARRNAGSVFSGRSRGVPRCAMSSGRRAAGSAGPGCGSVVTLLGGDPVVLLEDLPQQLPVLHGRRDRGHVVGVPLLLDRIAVHLNVLPRYSPMRRLNLTLGT